MVWRKLFVVCVTALVIGTSPLPQKAVKSSSIAISADGSRLVVANPDSGSVALIDTAALSRIAEVQVEGRPQTAAIDGPRAFVTTDHGVSAIDLATNSVVGSVRLTGDAFGVVADGTRAYVSCTAAARVVVLDALSLQPIASIATEPYPRGLALDRQQGRLYVSHFRSGRMSVIDLQALNVLRVIATDLDANLSQAVVLDTTARRAYLPQTRSNSTNQALLFDTTVFPTVATIDIDGGLHLFRDRISIDIADRPVNMPLDAVLTSTGKLYVVNAGSDDVSVIDLPRKTAIAHIAAGSNPRGIALAPDERTVYVNNALSGTVSVIDTATDRVSETIRATTIALRADLLNGKILFHTSNRTQIAKDRWISCATCHFDGGGDGRTWFFRDGPRNTPALFGVGSTLPMHWSGDLDELQDVESTVRTVQAGTGLANGPSYCEPACDVGLPNAGRSKDLDDLAAFMRSLPPPSHPGGIDRAAASRGAALFVDVRLGCVSCHPAPLFTDQRKHDVGTGRAAQERKGSSFDTPSLRGLYDTPPYLHDGSAPTLLDVLRGATGQHGNTAGLTDRELQDLVEFLRSIPFATPHRRAVGRLN